MYALNITLGISNLICGGTFVALALPLIRGRVKRNDYYGFRIKAAMVSDEAWIRATKIGGRHLCFWGIVIAVIGAVCFVVPPINLLWGWCFGLAPTLVGIGCAQAYREIHRA